ncbi:MAG: hypothetical protein U1F41_13455 [Burkholderiales bacterium]
MKSKQLLLVLPLFVLLAACDQKQGTSAAVKDKVNDALDRRPNEKLRDAAEDLRDGVKEAAKDLQAPSKGAK